MSAYSQSVDAQDFIQDFRKSVRSDLENRQDVIKDYGEDYERAYQLWNTFYAESYKDQSYYLGRVIAQNKSSLIDLECLAA